ncbi:hypothetical protein SISNIDRAFT_107734 [Sistotremastrum niveocremeum HHB9708]|uniref:Transcription initiation factor IIF subunit beta n=1 Tax=Sistotremastrum niveocremeum HHB9708 TaxID=1314777 RepID=A0A164TYF9_9AGAM|nr:hypothetical protein SISNIDRAFT_107734 [Sistotremastrum niveocremeum HHB9708]
MDDEIQNEERKPFEDEGGMEVDEPDPDEILELAGGDGRIWCVKIPKFLMERWQSVQRANVHLATMRVYNATNNGKTRITLLLPHAERLGENKAETVGYDTDGLTQEYDLTIVNQAVENQLVVSEKEMDPPKGRARHMHLLGHIQHECHIRPPLNAEYRSTVKSRHVAANTPQRSIIRLEKDGMAGGQGALNKLASGTVQNRSFDNIVKTQKKGKEFERFARMPRDKLLDLLFTLFEEKSSWAFKDMRARTEQPADYLKEVLGGVAVLHRSGELNGQYTLLENFQNRESQNNAIKEEGSSSMPSYPPPGQGTGDGADDDEDEDEEDEDDDMEEVQ